MNRSIKELENTIRKKKFFKFAKKWKKEQLEFDIQTLEGHKKRGNRRITECEDKLAIYKKRAMNNYLFRKLSGLDLEIASSKTTHDKPQHSISVIHPAYAKLWRRSIAFIIDIGMFMVVPVIIMTAFDLNEDISAIIGIHIFVLGFSVMESSQFKGALGKKVMRITVNDIHGDKIGFLKAVGRNSIKYLSICALGIPFLFIFITIKKQTLHDLSLKTVVFSKS